MADSKIDLLDPPEVVTKKIKKAVAAPKVVEENGVLAFVEFVLLPAAELKGKREFRVERERDGLEPLVYTTIEQMHEDYRNDVVRKKKKKKKQKTCSSFEGEILSSSVLTNIPPKQLTPQLLKPAVSKMLNELLAPIQAAFSASKEWQEVAERAYPPPPKKEKKVKNKGTRHPGALKKEKGEAVALPDRTAEGS
jgi:tyrosyl-tRNA synthetase